MDGAEDALGGGENAVSEHERDAEHGHDLNQVAQHAAGLEPAAELSVSRLHVARHVALEAHRQRLARVSLHYV